MKKYIKNSWSSISDNIDGVVKSEIKDLDKSLIDSMKTTLDSYWADVASDSMNTNELVEEMVNSSINDLYDMFTNIASALIDQAVDEADQTSNMLR